MKLTSTFQLFASVCLSALLVPPTVAQVAVAGRASVAPEQEARQGQLTVVSAQSLDSDATEPQTIEIRIANDTIRAKRNGKEIPESQVRREGDRIILTDADGNEIKDIYVVQPLTSAAVAAMPNFEGQPNLWQMTMSPMGEAGEEPKVVIGVQLGAPGPALEKHLKLKPDSCTMITGLYEGLPADKAGLGEYDIIVTADGQDLSDRQTLHKLINSKNPGETIELTVIQAGEKRNVTVEVAAYDAQAMSSAKFRGQASPFFSNWSTQWEIQPELFPLIELYKNSGSPVIVAPDVQVPGQPDVAVPRAGASPSAPRANRPNVEQKLQRLDERMAELERLLEKLIEQDR